MSPLDSLLRHFSLHAGVFYTGNICGRHDFEQDPMRGHLHVIRHGVVELIASKREKFEITEPTLVFCHARMLTDWWPTPELARRWFAAQSFSMAAVPIPSLIPYLTVC